MFAYCLNNPVAYSDFSGQFAITAALIGSVIGGAVAGALIGASSYLVSSHISGTEVTVWGMIGAISIGVLTGAIGGVAGNCGKIVKTALSVGAGVVSGIYAGVNTQGTTGQKIVTGLSVGLISAGSTLAGASVNSGGLPPFETAFANYSTTLSVGVPAEIAAVSMQQVINNSSKTSDLTNGTAWIDNVSKISPNIGNTPLQDYLRRKHYGEMPTFP